MTIEEDIINLHNEVIKLYNEKKSFREIAEQLNITKSKVEWIIKKNRTPQDRQQDTGQKDSFNLKEEAIKKITFNLPKSNESKKSNIKINNYNIPVFITGFSGEDSFAKPDAFVNFEQAEINTIVLKN